MRPDEPGRSYGRVVRVGLVALTAAALASISGCSPENGRPRGGGLGADIGNTTLPIEMHGRRNRNNPAFAVPDVGRVPSDAKGVPGWWVGREQ